ncbi:ZIP family metal transporter [Arthrobacter sp. NPDC055138]
MLPAFGWGLLAGSSYFLGGLLALRWRAVNSVLLGVLTGIGAGALLSAVAYKLIDEAGRLAGGSGFVGAGLLGGAVATSWVVTGASRGTRLSAPPLHEPRFLVIALSVVAESIVIAGGLVSAYGISIAMLAAVFLCGVPEAMADTGPLRKAGLTTRHVMTSWLAMTILCGVSVAGFVLVLGLVPPEVVAFVLSFAGGGVLTNVTVRMVPEALRDAGAATGIAIAIGFGLSFVLVEVVGKH